MGVLKLVLDSGAKTIEVQEGASLFAALAGEGVDFGSNCGGHGICGRCRVKVLSGDFAQPEADEQRAFSEADRAKGFRLACRLKMPSGDCAIEAKEFSDTAHILMTGVETDIKFDPLVRPEYDAGADVTRIYGGERLLCEKKGKAECYALAVDIGTTTVVAYLLDLAHGRQLGVTSMLNPQRSVGADVISRAGYSIDNPNGLKELSDMILNAITELAKRLCGDLSKIYHVTLVGNTIMMHMAAMLPVNSIAVAPYTPAYTEGFEKSAKEMGWEFGEGCVVSFLPCIAGYVGADTIAAALASGMGEADELSLLIDIGTNGEMLLGNKDKLLACSAAAGPAFEGGHISRGMGGVAGAINSVKLEDGAVLYTTIDGAEPKGFCGSGLIDAIALLVGSGIVDETGYLDGESGLLPDNVKTDESGSYMFAIAQSGGEDIAVTQRDVREVQLAKGAVAAGIEILLRAYGVREDDVKKVYLAGGFGTYIDYDSACTIGLIPKQLRSKIISLGNAAGVGAKIAALSKERLAATEDLRELSKYIELGERADFQVVFPDKMMFD